MGYTVEIRYLAYHATGIDDLYQEHLKLGEVFTEFLKLKNDPLVKIDGGIRPKDPSMTHVLGVPFEFKISSEERNRLIKAAAKFISAIGPSGRLSIYEPPQYWEATPLVKSILKALKDYKKT